jgi:hypothetical protein
MLRLSHLDYELAVMLNTVSRSRAGLENSGVKSDPERAGAGGRNERVRRGPTCATMRLLAELMHVSVPA